MAEAAAPPRSTAAWRDRLAGRRLTPTPEADDAIRHAYEASGLARPRHIIWADGPDEAANTISFLIRPPRTQRSRALCYAVLGTVAWAGIVLAVVNHPTMFDDRRAILGAALALALAGAALCLALCARLPAPPGQKSGSVGPVPIWIMGTILCVATAQVVALTVMPDLPAGLLGRDPIAGTVVVLGAVPGVLLFLRARRAYRGLPLFLREVRPVRSVAGRMRAARQAAWSDRAIPPGEGLAPHEALVRLFDEAHRRAFAPRAPFGAGRDDGGGMPPSAAMRALSSSAMGRGIWSRHWQMFGWVPPYFDGVEDASRAGVVDRVEGQAPRAARSFVRLAFAVDRLYPFDTVGVAVRPPTLERLDAEGRPHADSGPALAWADGTVIHAWRGRAVPPELVDPEMPLTLARVLREFDPGSRWVLIERYGLGRFMRDAGAEEVHRDASGRLYRLRNMVGPPIVAVRVVNHSPEPDGTFREFWLHVPPAITTARAAVAWTFGLREDEYQPWRES